MQIATNATFTLQRRLSGKTLKEWRKAHQFTAHALAVELGVSRQYVKSIEGGSLEASQKLIQRFDELRSRLGDAVAAPAQTRTVTVHSHFELPDAFEILSKPQRCRGCRKWFIPVTPNQRMHTTAKCQRAARKHSRTRKGKRT